MQKRITGYLAVCLAIAASVTLAQTRPSQPSSRNGRGQFFQEMQNWTKQNMPNLHQLASDPKYKDAYGPEAANRYRTYTSNRDPKSRDKIQTTFRREDMIFGLVLEFHQAADNDKPAILERINQATRELVMSFLEERRAHISALQKDIAEQQRKLEDDTSKIDDLVESRVNSRFLKERSTTQPGNEAPSNTSQPSMQRPAGGTLASPEQTPR